MKARAFVKSFLVLLPCTIILAVSLSVLLIRYDRPEISDIRYHELGYNTLAHHRFTRTSCDNDIVMIGDSTLLMGVIPKVIEDELHARVINLGLYATSGLNTYTLLLDNYLAHNRKPKCVVFYFAASTPYLLKLHSYEKCYTQLKYGEPAGALLQPDEVDATDCVRTAGTIVQGVWRNLAHQAKARERFAVDQAAMDANHGFVANAVTTPLPATFSCNTREAKAADLAFVDRLRKRYQAKGIKVLYYVAPMPEGEAGFEQFRRDYQSADNTVVALPNSLFADSRHPTPAGARVTSKLVAAELKKRLLPLLSGEGNTLTATRQTAGTMSRGPMATK